MPSRLIYYTKNKDDIMRIINDRNSDKLFIVKLKGGIYDENSINKCINFPPIFGNIHVKPTSNVVSEIMSNQYMKVNKPSNLEKVKPEKKLTQLLSTMGEYMVFSTYYLWLLLDDFDFKIDDVEEMAVFHRTTCFETWYNEMMSKRIDFQKQGKVGGEKWCNTSGTKW
jgi:hypothetical protein